MRIRIRLYTACRKMAGKSDLVFSNRYARSHPMIKRGRKLYTWRCTTENNMEERNSAGSTPQLFLNAEYRNPLKKTSSMTGPIKATTTSSTVFDILLFLTRISILLEGASIPKKEFITKTYKKLTPKIAIRDIRVYQRVFPIL